MINDIARWAVGGFALLFVAMLGSAVWAGDTTAPAAPAVYLAFGDRPGLPAQASLLSWEIYRQALLIAARDELGLQTRDASLREWRSTVPADLLVPSITGTTITIEKQSPGGPQPFWSGSLAENDWPQNCANLVTIAEGLSRHEFVDALRNHGWSGKPNALKPDAAAPVDDESLLGDLDELSQFSVLRITDAAIRSDGESPARLGVLVRAYANLSQLTRYHWSDETNVFAARALLYAERMVNQDPKSANALWHRAYARATAGLIRAGLDDLAEADRLKTGAPPAWAALLEPLCKYDPMKLKEIATTDTSNAPLATFFAFLTVEHSGCQAATMNFAQAAFNANPQCLRLVDAMCDNTGPGMLNQLTEQGPNIFSHMLGARLKDLPGPPAGFSDLLNRLRRPGGNPAGRETICQSLLDAAAPEKDRGEPSWAALGRCIQETTFVHVERRAKLIAEQWGVDASDYVRESRPLIVQHPYKGIVDAYGLLHSNDPEALKDAIADQELDQITGRQIDLWELEWRVQSHGPTSATRVFQNIFRNLNCTAGDLELYVNLYRQQLPKADQWVWRWFQIAAPDAPMAMVGTIHNRWDDAKSAAWEADLGNYPTVAFTLGEKYAVLNRWEDAERCLKKYLVLSPDQKGYQALANTYHQRGMDDEWLSTLQEFLSKPDYGLQHAQVEVEIAQYYMAKGDYQSAVSYADSAGQTGAGWGLECAARAHSGLGDWDTAESLIKENIEHYSMTPFTWYAWCLHTGHGHKQEALAAMHEYLATHQGRLNSEDLMQGAAMDVLEKKDADAMALFQQREKMFAGPLSELHIAVIADGLQDFETRDSALLAVPPRPKTIAPLNHVATALQVAIQKGVDPDPKAIDTALRNASAADRITICYLVGSYLDHHGNKDGATAYFRRCIFGFTGYSVDLTLAEDALRQRGLNLVELERANRPSTKPLVTP